MSILTALSGFFQSLVRNRVTEKDIRDWLDQNGYQGRTAQFVEIELHAIRRPGWEQIFRFSGQALDREDQRCALFGVVFDDERYNRTEVTLFGSAMEQSAHLRKISDGFLLRRRDR